jgi:pyridoxine kinase
MNILSLTSHVCYGHVGAQASVLPLQRLGHEVWLAPTVLLSNHPGYDGYGGGPVKRIRFNDLVDSMIIRGFVADCDALHTGYLGQGGVEHAALRALAQIRRKDGDGLYLCDPVMGDHGRLYVSDEVVAALRDVLVPAADIVTPNRYELELLTGRTLSDLASVLAACRALQDKGPRRVVCTTAMQDAETLTLLAVDGTDSFVVRLPYIAGAPFGTGDAFAGILLGRVLNGEVFSKAVTHAAASVHGMIRASKAAGAAELAVVAAQDEITAPTTTLVAEFLSG